MFKLSTLRLVHEQQSNIMSRAMAPAPTRTRYDIQQEVKQLRAIGQDSRAFTLAMDNIEILRRPRRA